MLHRVSVNDENFVCRRTEFIKISKIGFENLNILSNLPFLERIVSLIKELTLITTKKDKKIGFFGHCLGGGYVPIKVSGDFETVYIHDEELSDLKIINENICSFKIDNISFDICEDYDFFVLNEKVDVTTTNAVILDLNGDNSIVGYKHIYQLSGTSIKVYIPECYHISFLEEFYYYINMKELKYDNLLHLAMIVKNGGNSFREMLEKNINSFDRWTILDTGSTDNTLEIINDVLVGKKKGNLFQEPFINFMESRNRCLDLAGEKCKYIIMLDDTYIINGNLRGFLSEMRGDQNASSLSLYISDNKMKYTSNRIIKSHKKLRFIYKIHEIIQIKNNFNMLIPENINIFDISSNYMTERTLKRKEFDLKLLFEMVEEEPDVSRHLYYIGQTYFLLNEYEKAFKYYILRTEHHDEGFVQEKLDSYFQAGYIAMVHLNKPLSECEDLFRKSYELDKKRPDSLYYMAMINKILGDRRGAFEKFKEAHSVGCPNDTQYNIKPNITFYFIPLESVELAYEFKDYNYGLSLCETFLINNDQKDANYKTLLSWYKIFINLLKIPTDTKKVVVIPQKPLVVFIADGGFSQWTGRDILTRGVGGSETFMIEIARYIQQGGKYDVVMFCNCPKDDVFEGVKYTHLNNYYNFIVENSIHTCVISRFSDYLPVTLEGNVENVYMILHDLIPTGNVLVKHEKLKKIFCLSEWHVQYFTNIFPSMKDITVPFYYGIDFGLFKKSIYVKKQHNFIYSSFPNRGLLPLLIMWPRIVEKFPDSILNIHCDIDGKWVNDNYKEQMDVIRRIMISYQHDNNFSHTMVYHGWTDKKKLAQSWEKSDIWFYPCIFMETFCLTALEAALSRTFAITTDLAALKNTVGNRGILIEGNPMTQEWQDRALLILFDIMSNPELKEQFVEKNYNWALSLSWKDRAECFKKQYLDGIEYSKKLCWVDDNPENFRKIVDLYVPKSSNILEIGSDLGKSIVNILKLLNFDSFGVAIDEWNKESEQQFLKNIKLENMDKRITSFSGLTTDILQKLFFDGLKFNFIYFNGMTKCIDCYVNMVLSWNLLNTGGILGIDGYLYLRDVILESPFEAVKHFLEKYKGRYQLLSTKEQRVFLKKLK